MNRVTPLVKIQPERLVKIQPAPTAVHRNLLWASERVNARGGVLLPGGCRPLELVRMDSKGNPEEALATLRGALEGLRLARIFHQ